MRPLVLVVAPNPFGEGTGSGYEADFWLRTRSGHLASFSNLVRLFHPVGATPPALVNPWRAARPLAGYYLESFLKTHGFDARATFTPAEVAAFASAHAPPLAVALSTTFVASASDLSRIVAELRSILGPDVPIVVGGQLAWKQHLWGDLLSGRAETDAEPGLAPLFGPSPEPVLRDLVYVASEFGEHTLLALLAAFREGARTADDLSRIGNLVLWTGEGWRCTGRADERVDLDRDFTRWDLVDEMPRNMVPVRTSVGCPHRCEFCDFVAVHPRLRLRSASSIVEELRLIAARGGTSVSFVDDNALSTPARARTLAQALCDSDVRLRWGGYLRADRVAPEDAVLLARSGLAYGWCGIESGDPEVLRAMNKRSDPAAARGGIDALTSAGIDVLTTFVLGFPGETRASIDASIGFLNGLRSDARGRVEFSVFPFHVFPGAPVDAPARRRALGLTGLFDRWRHATMSADEVRARWAPYFFRGVDASYTYYGGDDSLLWSVARRNAAIAARKALTLAFLDGAADEVVQDRFAALYRALRFAPGEARSWREYLAPRAAQPGAPGLAGGRDHGGEREVREPR